MLINIENPTLVSIRGSIVDSLVIIEWNGLDYHHTIRLLIHFENIVVVVVFVFRLVSSGERKIRGVQKKLIHFIHSILFSNFYVLHSSSLLLLRPIFVSFFSFLFVRVRLSVFKMFLSMVKSIYLLSLSLFEVHSSYLF